MSILAELNTIFSDENIKVETGTFSEIPPEKYLVLTPLSDEFSLFSDDFPLLNLSEVRISIFSKTNYLDFKTQIEILLLRNNFALTLRNFVGFDSDTKYYHYNIDCEKEYIYAN
jgi:hypothetical protein